MSKLTLSFNNTQFHIVKRSCQVWLTSTEIAKSLGYKNDNAVSRIYARNSDEFAPGMSQKVNLTLSGNLQKDVRIFSLRGAHLVGMFARTPIAKDFRKWVLDVLDRETQSKPTPAPAPVAPIPLPVPRFVVVNGSLPRYLTFYRGCCNLEEGADNTFDGGQTAPTERLFHALKVFMGWMSQTARLAACPSTCYQHPSHPMPLIRQKGGRSKL